jgi:hypothetical protein
MLFDLVRIAEKKQFCLIRPAVVVQVKLQFLIAAARRSAVTPGLFV